MLAAIVRMLDNLTQIIAIALTETISRKNPTIPSGTDFERELALSVHTQKLILH